MAMIPDTALFYGGLILAGAALLGLVLVLTICGAKRKALDKQLRIEYGPENRHRRRRGG